MERYSLSIGIVGVLAGVALMILHAVSPKPTVLPVAAQEQQITAPTSAETSYNTGKTTPIPGTEMATYENPNLGIRFNYLKTLGEVVVDAQDEAFLVSFVQKAGEDKILFLAFPRMRAANREGYWGDLGQELTGKETDVCAAPWQKSWFTAIDCKNFVTTAGLSMGKVTGEWDGLTAQKTIISVYLLPHTTVLYNAAVISDERLLGAKIENASDEIAKIVSSLEFFAPPQPL